MPLIPFSLTTKATWSTTTKVKALSPTTSTTLNSSSITPKKLKLETLFNQYRLAAYRDYLQSQGLSAPSIDRKLSSLSTFQKFLGKEKTAQRGSYRTQPFPNPSLSLVKGRNGEAERDLVFPLSSYCFNSFDSPRSRYRSLYPSHSKGHQKPRLFHCFNSCSSWPSALFPRPFD